MRVPADEHDAPQPARHQGAQHGPGDVGGPAHDHRRLGHPRGVVHREPIMGSRLSSSCSWTGTPPSPPTPSSVPTPSSRRRRLRCRTGLRRRRLRRRRPGPARRARRRGAGWGGHEAEPTGQVGHEHAVGVHPIPHGAPVRQAGVHGLEQLGTEAGVLGQVHAPTRLGHDVVERVEEGAERGRRRRGSRPPASTPRAGTTGGRGRRGRTASARSGTRPGGCRPDAPTTARRASSAPVGTTNWCCTRPRGPYMRFQSPTPSRGWK